MKVCSKSIIFDSQDFDLPLIKFEFAQVEAIEPARNSIIAKLEGEDVFQIRVNVTVELKENNNIAPYVFKKEKSTHRFSIKYVSQTSFLTEVNRLFAISRLPSYEADEKIKQIVTERESAIVFDRSWLEAFDERPLRELAAVRLYHFDFDSFADTWLFPSLGQGNPPRNQRWSIDDHRANDIFPTFQQCRS